MDEQLPDVPALRAHEPPPGGLAMLRERLDAERPRRWWLAVVPAIVALAALVIIVVRMQPPHERAVPEEPERVITALPDPEIGGDEVSFYWVASSPRGAVRPRPQTISIDDVPRVTAFAAP